MGKNKLAGSSLLDSLRRLPRKSLLFRTVFLAVTVLVAASFILPLGWAVSHNRMGFFAGAAAGGVCLVAAWTALVLSEPFRKPQRMLALLHAGMIIRMGVPLTVALIVFFRGGPLADAGFLYYLIVFYVVALTVETFLSWPGCDPCAKNVPPKDDFVT